MIGPLDDCILDGAAATAAASAHRQRRTDHPRVRAQCGHYRMFRVEHLKIRLAEAPRPFGAPDITVAYTVMRVTLRPEDVASKQFTSTRLRPGYDEAEVDEFLEEVVAELRWLHQEIDALRAARSGAGATTPGATPSGALPRSAAGHGSMPVQPRLEDAAGRAREPAEGPVRRLILRILGRA